MDNQNAELIKKIYEMVRQAIEKLGGNADGGQAAGPACCPAGGKAARKPLILTGGHGTTCHGVLERIGGECALMGAYDGADLDGACCVVLYDLTLENMSKLACGCADSPYTALAARALLGGMPVYAVREGIELLACGQQQGAYYNVLRGNLSKLEKCGVTIVAEADLEKAALGAIEPNAPAGSKGCAAAVFEVQKKILSENDVKQAHANGACEIVIGAKTIITSLASELAIKRSIRITRGQ